jgi:hypothetical protein
VRCSGGKPALRQGRSADPRDGYEDGLAVDGDTRALVTEPELFECDQLASLSIFVS